MNTHKAPKDRQNIREKLFSLSDGGADHRDLDTAPAIPTSLPSSAYVCPYYAFAHGTDTTSPPEWEGRGEASQPHTAAVPVPVTFDISSWPGGHTGPERGL